MENGEETRFKHKEDQKEQQEEQHDEFLTKMEEILLAKAEKGYDDQLIIEEDESEANTMNLPEFLEQDTLGDQIESHHEFLEKMEETLLKKAEKGYEDQYIIWDDEPEHEILNPLELVDQDTLEEQHELNNDNFCEKMEEILLAKAEEGFDDQLIIEEDESEAEIENPPELIEQDTHEDRILLQDEFLEKMEETLLKKAEKGYEDQYIVWDDETEVESLHSPELKEQESPEENLKLLNREDSKVEEVFLEEIQTEEFVEHFQQKEHEKEKHHERKLVEKNPDQENPLIDSPMIEEQVEEKQNHREVQKEQIKIETRMKEDTKQEKASKQFNQASQKIHSLEKETPLYESERHKSILYFFLDETNLPNIAKSPNSRQLTHSDQIGYVQKDGKWHIETNWIGYPSIQMFLHRLDKHQIKGFNLWLQIRNELSNTTSNKRIYYDIRVNPGQNIPPELENRRVYIQNNKRYFNDGWNHSKFVHRPKSINTVIHFQDSFLEKMDNKWFKIHPRTAKKIRDAIYQQFSEKYTTFKEIRTKLESGERRRTPDLFFEKFDLLKTESSWIRLFQEYLVESKPKNLANDLLKLRENSPDCFDYFLSTRYEIRYPSELKNRSLAIELKIEHGLGSISNNLQKNLNEILKAHEKDIMFQSPDSGFYSPHLFRTLESLGTHSNVLLLNSLIAAKEKTTVIDNARTLDLSFYEPTSKMNLQLPENLRNKTLFVFNDYSYTNAKWSQVLSKELSTPIQKLCNIERGKMYPFTDPNTRRLIRKWLNITSFIRESFGITGKSTIFVSNYKLDTIGSAARLLLQEKKFKDAPDVEKLKDFFKTNPTLFQAIRTPRVLNQKFSFLVSEINRKQNLDRNSINLRIAKLFSIKGLKRKELKNRVMSLVQSLQNSKEIVVEARKEWIWKWNIEMKKLETEGQKVPNKLIRRLNRRLSMKKDDVLIWRTSGKYYYLENYTELAKDINFDSIGKVSPNNRFDSYMNAINLIEKVFDFKKINDSYFAMVKEDCDSYLKKRILSKSGPTKRLWNMLTVDRLRGIKAVELVKEFKRSNLGSPAVYRLKHDIEDIKKVIYAKYNEMIRTNDFNRNVARDRYGIVEGVRQKLTDSCFRNYSTGIISIDKFKVYEINLNLVLKDLKEHFDKPFYHFDGFRVFEKFMTSMLSNVEPVILEGGTEPVISIETIRKAGFPVSNPWKIDRKGHHIAWFEPYKSSWMNAATRYIFSNLEYRKSLKLLDFNEKVVTVPTGSGRGRIRRVTSTQPDFITYPIGSNSKVGEIIQVKNIGRYIPRYPVDFFRDLIKTAGWTIDGHKSCGKNVFVMKANEISKFKINKLIDGHHMVIVADWGNCNDLDRLGEGTEAAREILQGFNLKKIDTVIERPFISNYNGVKIIDSIQDTWKMSKGYILKGMPPKSTVKTWNNIEIITQDAKDIVEFYLRILDWLAINNNL